MTKKSNRLVAFDRKTGSLKLGIAKFERLVRELKKKRASGNTPASWEQIRLIYAYENQVLVLKKELNIRTTEPTKNQNTIYLSDSPIRLVQGGSPGLKK